ncbi:MAG: hypothetical protein QXU40_01370 [Candidatus Pacearchaeota archaeon]
MFGIFPLSPAYGRDYKSAKEVKEAFEKNVDFKTAFGQYINLTNIIDYQKKNPENWPDEIPIRYNKLQNVTLVSIKKAIKKRKAMIND